MQQHERDINETRDTHTICSHSVNELVRAAIKTSAPYMEQHTGPLSPLLYSDGTPFGARRKNKGGRARYSGHPARQGTTATNSKRRRLLASGEGRVRLKRTSFPRRCLAICFIETRIPSPTALYRAASPVSPRPRANSLFVIHPGYTHNTNKYDELSQWDGKDIDGC